MDATYNYEIRVEGHLSARWCDWFDGLAIHNDPGNETVLTGAIHDQAALFGILNKIRSLNLVLISINRMPDRKGK